MRISMGSWAFSFGPYASHPIALEDVVARLGRAGYDGVELSGFPPHVSLDQYPDRESRAALRQRLADHGLGVSGYSPDFTSVNPAAPLNRGKYLDLFRRYIDLCVDVGSPVIRVDTGAAPGSIPEKDYRRTMDHLGDVWREAAGLAEPAGVRVVWEFEPGFAYNKLSEVLALHDRVAHRNFQILFDTCHAYMCGVACARQHPPPEVLEGGVEEFLRRLQGRIGHVHLTDSDGSLHGDETSTHTPLGEGLIDWKTLVPKLLAIPEIEWWCIDLCFWPGSWELVESSLVFVRGLLSGGEREGTAPGAAGAGRLR